MKFKKGDKIYQTNDKEYYEQCVSMEYLHKNLKIGDIFLTYRDTNKGEITEFEFLGFTYCKWLGNGAARTCKTICKGYLKIKRENKGEIQICGGYSQSSASCVLKIIKKNYLEDELFEI